MQRAVGTDGDVIEQHRAIRSEIDRGERRPAMTLKPSQGVDVTHPQGVAVNRHTLGRVERRAMHAPLDKC